MIQQLALAQAPALARFEVKVQRDPETGCWNWLACCALPSATKDSRGYGQFSIGRQVVRAHRFAYQVFVGPIPSGLQIDHLCGNRTCVNPEHLEAVTSKVNHRRSPRCNRTECPRGHVYDLHSFIDRRGYRECRLCKAARTWASAQRRRGSKRSITHRRVSHRGTLPMGSAQISPLAALSGQAASLPGSRARRWVME